MKYSMFSWYGYFMPFEERIQILRKAGFDEVMISWEDELAPYPTKKETFPDIVRKHGLGITNLHAPFMGYNDIWEKDSRGSEHLFHQLAEMVAACRDHHIETIVVHTCDLALKKYTLENGLTFFKRLTDVGEKHAVNIAVENVSRQYLLRHVLDNINSNYLGLCYDSSHDFMEEGSKGQLLSDYSNRVKAMHLSDNDLHVDRHWIPGEGKIPFGELFPKILSVGCNTIAYEVMANSYWRGKKPAEFCATLLKSLMMA